MRAGRCVLTLLVVACVQATSARSGELSLRWDRCAADGGAENRSFACASNAGEQLLVGSFRMSAPLSGVTGIEIFVDVVAQAEVLPAWWGFRGAGSCRSRALTVDGALAPSAEHCVDWAGGMSAGGLAAFRSSASAANVARMIAGFAVPADAASDLVADRDYFAFNARISNANSTGELACGGCTTPTCIVFTLLRIATPPGPKGVPSRDVSIAAPADGTHDHIVTWQGVQRAGDSTRALCPAIVAARDSSAGPGAHR